MDEPGGITPMRPVRVEDVPEERRVPRACSIQAGILGGCTFVVTVVFGSSGHVWQTLAVWLGVVAAAEFLYIAFRLVLRRFRRRRQPHT